MVYFDKKGFLSRTIYDVVNKYIIDIYEKWIKLLIDSDKSDDKKQIREYYNIESLWGDAKITTIQNKY
mgnify:CR=1 FL=1